MDILSKIVAHTETLIASRKQDLPLAEIVKRAEGTSRQTHSLTAALSAERPHVIAEFKRRSPSRPSINPDARPGDVALAYETGGASAMSILTEPEFFGGAPADLEAARDVVSLPLLRKDFMIDPYQFYEARCMGADLVLLIARILDRQQLADYCLLAHELGMEVLCEIHDLNEMEKVADAPVDFLGVNCRDLKKFETNLDHLVDMADHLPDNIPLVAESGIHGRDDLQRLYRSGYRLFLIGEYLMKRNDPAATLRELTAL